jgi:hypothetical protein
LSLYFGSIPIAQKRVIPIEYASNIMLLDMSPCSRDISRALTRAFHISIGAAKSVSDSGAYSKTISTSLARAFNIAHIIANNPSYLGPGLYDHF